MVKQLLIVDYNSREILKSFTSKETIKISGKKFVDKFGSRIVEIVTIGTYLKVRNRPIMISDNMKLILEIDNKPKINKIKE